MFDYIRDKERGIRGKLSISLMALVALALVLSLVAALAPAAGAQDSGAAPEGAARWMRYNMPAAQGWEAAAGVNQLNGFQPKNCCITVEYGCHPIPTSGTNPEPAAATGTATPYKVQPRWFCMDDEF